MELSLLKTLSTIKESTTDGLILSIAKDRLGIYTLETRNRDSLDFHSVSVGSVKAALEDAYRAGFKDGYNSRKPEI